VAADLLSESPSLSSSLIVDIAHGGRHSGDAVRDAVPAGSGDGGRADQGPWHAGGERRTDVLAEVAADKAKGLR
jgi:hypothetical protein